ncbi:hypothetical protein RMSM_05975 [Rhodopirellula maiorica SM1]|uniref:Uncharacterized protein n=1 Tax=Rhodopirellula maiorica SM1 TaxID=1265738 RepID=M5RDE9_9BACT|nr:hypothetical protein [Rhodopirellula maiorica]EMI17101.1 hypothetical protein RMSM_05975 [Rhodopirellula maiorica SM1]
MITPKTARLRASDSIDFEVEQLPDGWMIEPPAIGTWDAENRRYTAPDQIAEQSEVTLIVKAADGAEIDRAAITLTPPPPRAKVDTRECRADFKTAAVV